MARALNLLPVLLLTALFALLVPQCPVSASPRAMPRATRTPSSSRQRLLGASAAPKRVAPKRAASQVTAFSTLSESRPQAHALASASDFQQWPGISGGAATNVTYHGGPLMTGHITVYYILYGNWPANSGQDVLRIFVYSLSSGNADAKGPSLHKWWQITTQYTNAAGTGAAPRVWLGSNVTVGGSYSSHLNDGSGGTTDDIWSIVSQQISAGKLPLDPSGFYAVLTSSDVRVGDSVSGFCGSSGYCGWHSQMTLSGVPVRYAFIGDPTQQCNFGCGHNNGLSVTPNGHFGVDSLISTLAHELSEAATNPDTATGYWALDQDGTSEWENADLCSFNYVDGSNPKLKSNPADTFVYNLFGVWGTKFLIQTNVNIKSQQCVLQATVLGSPPPAPPPPSPPVKQGTGAGVVAADGAPAPAPFLDDPFLPPEEGSAPSTFLAPENLDFPSMAPSYAPVGDVIGAPTPSGVTPDVPCSGADNSTCTGCADKDGCKCYQGGCLPLCQAAPLLGLRHFPCTTCVNATSCFCSRSGVCQAPGNCTGGGRGDGDGGDHDGGHGGGHGDGDGDGNGGANGGGNNGGHGGGNGGNGRGNRDGDFGGNTGNVGKGSQGLFGGPGEAWGRGADGRP